MFKTTKKIIKESTDKIIHYISIQFQKQQQQQVIINKLKNKIRYLESKLNEVKKHEENKH